MNYLFDQKAGAAARPDRDFTVFVVDDEQETCESLRFFLESLHYRVRSWNDPKLFLDEVTGLRGNGCIILDVRMPDMSGLEVFDRLLALGNVRPVVFLTSHGDIAMAVRAVKRGALDFLTKPPEEEKLREVLEAAENAARSMSADLKLADDARRRFDSLTSREKDVIRLVGLGLMNKIIADRLGISEKTVKQHRGLPAASWR